MLFAEDPVVRGFPSAPETSKMLLVSTPESRLPDI